MRTILIFFVTCLPALTFGQGINKVHYGSNGKLSSSMLGSDDGNYSFTQYHSNGFKSSIGKYKDGEMHGTWKTWDVNGKLTAVAHYRNGEKTGKWVINESDHTYFEISFSHNHMINALKKDDHGHILAKR